MLALSIANHFLRRFGTITLHQSPSLVAKEGYQHFNQHLRRLTTASSTDHTAVLENHVVMNKFGLEQKTIVQAEPTTVSFCRCWLSQTFPKCDGSHKHHNMLTGM